MPLGSKAGSMSRLKTRLAKSGSGPITFIPKSGTITVRFLDEAPSEFTIYDECWNNTLRKSFPYDEGVHIEGVDFDRKSTVFLANAINIENDKVIALQIKASVMSKLVMRYEKYGTINDRDYEITKFGSGLETEYDISPEPPKKINLSKYKPLDLEDALEKWLDNTFAKDSDDDDDEDGDDEDDEDEKKPAKKSLRRPGRSVAKRDSWDDEDEDEDEEKEDEEEDAPTAEEMQEMDWKSLNVYARGIGVTLQTSKRTELIKAIEKKRD